MLAPDSARGPAAVSQIPIGETLATHFDGFVDAYYAYDFNSPPQFDRAYTTQPARSDEFNVNLAYLGATLTDDRVRGRLAFQAGTSVQSNYASEPQVGTVSGPSVSRNIQEAYAGYKLAPSLWLDGGIYLSHVSAESFISRDNLTYTDISGSVRPREISTRIRRVGPILVHRAWP